MKKINFKAFTLVEMLIVIVIIGILIAALLPRLQGAQGMARDTSRQTGVSQLQTAIVAYQSLNGKRPGSGDGSSTNDLLDHLVTQNIMSALPTDPNLENIFTGIDNKVISGGGYSYGIFTKNSINRGGIVLMAKTETAGKSNWVWNWQANSGQLLPASRDMSTIYPCAQVSLGSPYKPSTGANQACVAENTSQLYYIVLY